MALFEGEEMVPVVTPDGRTISVPRSLAGMAPQQQITQPPGFTDETVYNVNPEIPSVTGGALPDPNAPLPDTAPQTATPDLPPVEIDTERLAEIRNVQQKAQAQQARAQAVYSASPQGRMDAVDAEAERARQAEEKAIEARTIAEVAQQDAVGEIQTNTLKRAAEIRAKQQMAAEQQMAADAKKDAEVTAFRKRIENTKIDREADHPILLAISAALAGLGSGMKGEKVDTADIIYRAIDHKVAAQMQNLDLLTKTYGFKREEQADLRDRGRRWLETFNTLAAAETERAALEVQAKISSTQNPILKARGAEAIGKLRAIGAEKHREAVQWGIDYAQKEKHQRDQLGVQYAGIHEQKLNRLEGARQADQRNETDLARIAASTLDAKGAVSTEQMKLRIKKEEDVSTRGLKDIKNSRMIYTRAGENKIRAAENLEKRAANIDPWGGEKPQAQAQAWREEAARLRQEADTYDVALGRDTAEAKKAMSQLAASTTLNDIIGELNQLTADSQNDRALFEKNGGHAQIEAKWNAMDLAVKDATDAGAWDRGLAIKLGDSLGKAPTEKWDDSNTFVALLKGRYKQDPKNAMARAGAFIDTMRQKTVNVVNGSSQNLDRKLTQADLFAKPRQPAAQTFEAQAAAGFKTPTPAEREEEIRNRSPLSQGVRSAGRRALSALGLSEGPTMADLKQGRTGSKSNEDIAKEAATAGWSTMFPTLAKGHEAWFESLRQRALGPRESGDAEVAEKLLISTVLDNIEKRPKFASGLTEAIQDSLPHVYSELLPRLPAGSHVEQTANQTAQIKAGAALTGLNELKVRGVTDPIARNTLAAKAGMGDKDAQKLLDELIQLRAQMGMR